MDYNIIKKKDKIFEVCYVDLQRGILYYKYEQMFL